MATKRPQPRLGGVVVRTPTTDLALTASLAALVVLLPLFWVADALPDPALTGVVAAALGATLVLTLAAGVEGYHWLRTR